VSSGAHWSLPEKIRWGRRIKNKKKSREKNKEKKKKRKGIMDILHSYSSLHCQKKPFCQTFS
jgi:hypothetical protein